MEWLEHNDRPDLAFFDVQLADGESFEVFKRIDRRLPGDLHHGL